MVTHNFENVIKHFARKKDLKNLWNYSTGLRGNDDGISMFKEVVVTTIRGEVEYAYSFTEYMVVNDIIRKYHNEPEKTIEKFHKSLNDVSYHSRYHSVSALRSLSIYYEHKRKFDFCAELREFALCIENNDAKNALASWIKLHDMWG
jgi:hypothetical protein